MKQQDTQETLDFYDLLVDESTDDFSDYVSISVSNEGNNTTVNVATVEDVPTVYSFTLDGVTAPDLESILQDWNVIN